MELTLKEKTILLKAARESISSCLDNIKQEEADICDYPALKITAGAFVTLKRQGRLRGCVGYVVSNKPLYETVCDAAQQAALYDPRFPQVTNTELDEIEIEISVLSPPFKMEKYDDIEIGKHGLILNDFGKRALLLPQVPVEYNMNRDQYLSALCEKAGVYKDTWQLKQLNISLFTAAVFSEEEVRKENGNN